MHVDQDVELGWATRLVFPRLFSKARKGARLLAALSLLLPSAHAYAWGPDGHINIGATADRLIVGTYAEEQVRALLGGMSLQDAAVWADCAKGVSPERDYTYEGTGTYAECKVFETPAGEAGMVDFVRRNDKNCQIRGTETSCHRQYHYSDIAIQRNTYAPNLTGARKEDIVGAVVAAIRVLKGEPAPAPFNLKDRREALLVLTHFVGDLHQPLHVGAVYLSKDGEPVDPDQQAYDSNTDTRGGNDILVRPGNMTLHHYWDTSQRVGKIDAAWLRQAKAVRRTAGTSEHWPATWATETLNSARKALMELQYGKKRGKTWSTRLPPGYTRRMDALKRAQLVKAGARLSQILQTIWPCRWREAESPLPVYVEFFEQPNTPVCHDRSRTTAQERGHLSGISRPRFLGLIVLNEAPEGGAGNPPRWSDPHEILKGQRE